VKHPVSRSTSELRTAGSKKNASEFLSSPSPQLELHLALKLKLMGSRVIHAFRG
jgi:hypothetical protein